MPLGQSASRGRKIVGVCPGQFNEFHRADLLMGSVSLSVSIIFAIYREALAILNQPDRFSTGVTSPNEPWGTLFRAFLAADPRRSSAQIVFFAEGFRYAQEQWDFLLLSLVSVGPPRGPPINFNVCTIYAPTEATATLARLITHPRARSRSQVWEEQTDPLSLTSP